LGTKAPKGYKWIRIKMTADSGACEHVIARKYLSVSLANEIKSTAAVTQGVKYSAANGHTLKNEGEIKLGGMTQEGNSVELSLQVVDVMKPLLSIRKMCDAGNRIVFDQDESYIEHKATGIRSKIEHDEGTYALWIWVMVPERDSPCYAHTRMRVPSTGRFQNLIEEDEEPEVFFDPEPVFTRLV
jgi:hypothetical protein